MLYILALFLPGLAVMLAGKFLTGLLLFALQLTLIGWVPATIVSFFIINERNRKN